MQPEERRRADEGAQGRRARELAGMAMRLDQRERDEHRIQQRNAHVVPQFIEVAYALTSLRI